MWSRTVLNLLSFVLGLIRILKTTVINSYLISVTSTEHFILFRTLGTLTQVQSSWVLNIISSDRNKTKRNVNKEKTGGNHRLFRTDKTPFHQVPFRKTQTNGTRSHKFSVVVRVPPSPVDVYFPPSVPLSVGSWCSRRKRERGPHKGKTRFWTLRCVQGWSFLLQPRRLTLPSTMFRSSLPTFFSTFVF